MEEKEKIQKRSYKKKNEFKINLFYNDKGESLERVIERAFKTYCSKNLI